MLVRHAAESSWIRFGFSCSLENTFFIFLRFWRLAENQFPFSPRRTRWYPPQMMGGSDQLHAA